MVEGEGSEGVKDQGWDQDMSTEISEGQGFGRFGSKEVKQVQESIFSAFQSSICLLSKEVLVITGEKFIATEQ